MKLKARKYEVYNMIYKEMKFIRLFNDKVWDSLNRTNGYVL